MKKVWLVTLKFPNGVIANGDIFDNEEAAKSYCDFFTTDKVTVEYAEMPLLSDWRTYAEKKLLNI